MNYVVLAFVVAIAAALPFLAIHLAHTWAGDRIAHLKATTRCSNEVKFMSDDAFDRIWSALGTVMDESERLREQHALHPVYRSPLTASVSAKIGDGIVTVYAENTRDAIDGLLLLSHFEDHDV